jgi:flagellin
MAINQAVRNANDGIGVAQIADGALQEISNLLTRAVTLAEEAATGTIDSTGRASLNAEYLQIQGENDYPDPDHFRIELGGPSRATWA